MLKIISNHPLKLFKKTAFSSLASSENSVYLGREIKSLKTFTEEDVRKFSELTGDFNPIHWDKEFCKGTIFGKPIVHGFLASSQIPSLAASSFIGCIYMSQTLQFKAPVYIGEEIRTKLLIKEIIKEKQRIILETTVEKTSNNQIVTVGQAIIKYPSL